MMISEAYLLTLKMGKPHQPASLRSPRMTPLELSKGTAEELNHTLACTKVPDAAVPTESAPQPEQVATSEKLSWGRQQRYSTSAPATAPTSAGASASLFSSAGSLC